MIKLSRVFYRRLAMGVAAPIAIAMLAGSMCNNGSTTPPPPARDYVTCNFTCAGDWVHRVALSQGSASCINEEINETPTYPNAACFAAGVDQNQAFQRTIDYYNNHQNELKLNWLHALGDPQSTTGVACPDPRETWVSFGCQPVTAASCSMQRNGAGSYTQCAAP